MSNDIGLEKEFAIQYSQAETIPTIATQSSSNTVSVEML